MAINGGIPHFQTYPNQSSLHQTKSFCKVGKGSSADDLWLPLEGQLASARVHRMFFPGFSWNLGKLNSRNGSAKLALPMVGMLLSWAAFGLTMFSDLSQIWLRRFCTKIPSFSNPTGSEFKLSSLQKYVFRHFTQLPSVSRAGLSFA